MPAPANALLPLAALQKVCLTGEVETHALADVHLEVAKGEYVAIAGPSGCGKTTLLSIIGLLDSPPGRRRPPAPTPGLPAPPTGGRYTLAGQDVTALDAAQRAQVRNRQIGFVFQAFNL